MMVVCEGGFVVYDIGFVNVLVDVVIVEYDFNLFGYDDDVVIVCMGQIDDLFFDVMFVDLYYVLILLKSIGKEYFYFVYVYEYFVVQGCEIVVVDVVCMFIEFIVCIVVCDVVVVGIGFFVVFGGGCWNLLIFDGFCVVLLEIEVVLVDEFGVLVDSKEVIFFVFIGWLIMYGVVVIVFGGMGVCEFCILGMIILGVGLLQMLELVVVIDFFMFVEVLVF